MVFCIPPIYEFNPKFCLGAKIRVGGFLFAAFAQNDSITRWFGVGKVNFINIQLLANYEYILSPHCQILRYCIDLILQKL